MRKTRKNFFRLCAAALVLLLLSACGAGEKTLKKTKYGVLPETKPQESFISCYYGGSSEIIYEDPKDIVRSLEGQNYNAVTVIVAWSLIEKSEGSFSFDPYDKIFQTVANAGYKLIVAIDTSGRPILKNGNVEQYSIPKWAFEKYPKSRAVDFNNTVYNSFDYNDTDHVDAVKNVYEAVLAWLSRKHAGRVEAVCPCIMEECEIKYPQKGYCWQSYSEKTKDAFRRFLLEKYGSVEKLNKKAGTDFVGIGAVDPPVINYNNTVRTLNNNESVLFADFMGFRENRIVEYLRPLTGKIRDHGFEAIGYFGQFMDTLDAIYASGVAQKCSELFDIAVIDYNFYDGYKENYNADIPAFLTNLMKNIGYKKVYTGMYFERVTLDGREDFVKELTDKIIKDGHSNGLEIGSLHNNTKSKVTFNAPKEVKTGRSKAALYTCEWNYYKTHGEDESLNKYLIDGALQLYSALCFELNIPVEVITDKNVTSGELAEFDILFIPSQLFVPQSTAAKIEEYIKNGGKAVQDLRYGEYDENGVSADRQTVFGIEDSKTFCANKLLIPEEKGFEPQTVSIVYGDIPNVCTCSGRGRSIFSCSLGEKVGMLTENTVTWGFQPQLMYKLTKDKSYLEFINDTVKYLTERS